MGIDTNLHSVTSVSDTGAVSNVSTYGFPVVFDSSKFHFVGLGKKIHHLKNVTVVGDRDRLLPGSGLMSYYVLRVWENYGKNM